MNEISKTESRNVQELESVLGKENLRRWDEVDPIYQQQIIQSVTPDTQIEGILYPNTQEELAAIIALSEQHQFNVLPCGSGSKIDWGGLVKNVSFVVSTERMNRLIEHAIGDLTVTVEAGMKFSELQEILAKEGQTLGFDPTYPEQATLGGIVATGDTNSLRQRYRSVRDMLLGISFVRSDGKIAKAGGRVVKNVAGYDLMKLLTGSFGTLGIISQITLRVYPQAEYSGTVVLSGGSDAIAKINQTLLSSALTPAAVDLISPQLCKTLGFGDTISLMVRFQSIPESVQQQSQRLIELGKILGLKGTYFDSDEANLWQQLKQQIWKSEIASPVICKIGVTPSNAVQTLMECQTIGLIHAGVGLGILRFETSSSETLLNLRNWCQSQKGFLTVLKAPIELKQQLDVWGYPGNGLNLMSKIKQQFDPKNQLSPNRFINGL